MSRHASQDPDVAASKETESGRAGVIWLPCTLANLPGQICTVLRFFQRDVEEGLLLPCPVWPEVPGQQCQTRKTMGAAKPWSMAQLAQHCDRLGLPREGSASPSPQASEGFLQPTGRLQQWAGA